MLIQRTIAQLKMAPCSAERAAELGQLGYMQWLNALPGNSDYYYEAMRAYKEAAPFMRLAPAITVFCDLLVASARRPLQPLELGLPKPQRRGGARARRLTL